MKSLFIAAAAAAALVVSAAGGAIAAPTVSLAAPCTLVQGGAPCIFNGNITNTNLTNVDSAYNGQTPNPTVPLDLAGFLTSPDQVGVSTNGMGATSGTLTADPGFDIDYYAVKGGNEFALYWIFPTTSVNWVTSALCAGRDCNAPGLSHLVYFEGPAPTTIPSVPEPATWAMMLVGAFGMGALLRRRQSPALA